MKKLYPFLLVLLFTLSFINLGYSQKIIPTNHTQSDMMNAYKLIFDEAYDNYRTNGEDIDSILFPNFSESSVYLIKSGENRGSFVLPRSIPGNYETVTGNDYTNYNWQAEQHSSIRIENFWKRVVIFESSEKQNGSTVSWESTYFKSVFNSYLWENWYDLKDEEDISNGISDRVRLLIIPAFNAYGENQKYYIDKIFDENPDMITRINTFLANGGTIYAEGNAVYFIERLGYLDAGAVDYSNTTGVSTGTEIPVGSNNDYHTIFFAAENNNMELYTHSVPLVTSENIEPIIFHSETARPLIFEINKENANNGRIICNLGLPTVKGL